MPRRNGDAVVLGKTKASSCCPGPVRARYPASSKAGLPTEERNTAHTTLTAEAEGLRVYTGPQIPSSVEEQKIDRGQK